MTVKSNILDNPPTRLSGDALKRIDEAIEALSREFDRFAMLRARLPTMPMSELLMISSVSDPSKLVEALFPMDDHLDLDKDALHGVIVSAFILVSREIDRRFPVR